MPAPSTLTAFKDAGWTLKRTGYDSEDATASNGEIAVCFSEITSGLRMLTLTAEGSSFMMPFHFEVTPELPEVIDLIIAAQPDLDWDNYKLLIGDIVRLGVPVSTQIDGEVVSITEAPENR